MPITLPMTDQIISTTGHALLVGDCHVTENNPQPRLSCCFGTTYYSKCDWQEQGFICCIR